LIRRGVSLRLLNPSHSWGFLLVAKPDSGADRSGEIGRPPRMNR